MFLYILVTTIGYTGVCLYYLPKPMGILMKKFISFMCIISALSWFVLIIAFASIFG